MLARCVATLKPPPELTLSQWADRYRILSAESSAEPGRWHTDKAPYQREIMDAIGDAHIRRVVIMCAAQLGKTELLLNILGYFMAYAPAPILVMQPTLDMGQTFSKDRLAPMIRDTPVLRGLVDVKSRYAGNTILKKNFPGGHITIVGANSATGLASRPIKVLLADEVDRYPGSAGTEGDPLSLAQKRQTTFWDKKTVMPDERKVAALSTLFGQWAIEGGAKITNNLGAYEKALAMVSDPSLYTGSMEREFIIQASTSESIDTMVKNSVTALKQDIGTEFLPVKKTLSLAVIDLMNGVRKDMPQLQTLAGTLADLLSAGISKLGDALQAALPYVQKTLDYVADNGPQVVGILGGLAGTFAAMKFAPLAGNILEGAGSLLFGESGGLGAAAGGSKRSGGLLGAVSSLFTGGQKFAGNAVGTISNVAEAAGVGATMANSNMTRTQWGAVTSNGSGSFMQRLENSAIGAYFGIKNRGTLTNQKGTDYKFMQGLMGVAGQITDAKQGGGLLGMAKNAVTSSPIGQYFGGIRAAAGNVANTTIGSKIVGFGKGTIGVSKEILAGIAGPEGLGLTNLVSGAKGLAQNGAG